jgi:hypothetical protein
METNEKIWEGCEEIVGENIEESFCVPALGHKALFVFW